MNLREAATRLLKDFDARQPGMIFECPELNLGIEDAYQLQFEVAALRQFRGERVAGYKIGCISKTMQQQLGIDRPVFGHVWESEIYRSGVELPANEFDGLAIEGEFAVRLRDDVTSLKWLRNNRDVIAGYHAAIELHNYVFRGPESDRAVELVANNAIHAGVVITDDAIDSNDFDPRALLQVELNAECMGSGVVTHLQNGALEIVAAVLKHLEMRGLHLKREQIILTGSPLPLWRVNPGDRISVLYEGLSDVCCTIAKEK